MAYVSLYRKWRPKTFDEVKGQEGVVATLSNQIKTGRIGHAYVFTGTRGTGKTSVAKIMAAAVNCTQPKDGNPCCECESCIQVLAGNNINVREIDAASNNGVDNVREIREDVMYPPAGGKYKVYIIDEAHMLSSGAFNALLKTLEEPPEYVIFILATTEAAKLPVTILSRCQRYDFHRITAAVIENQLNELTKKEGITAEEKAIKYIARKADGAMRDALSLLDRCAAFCNEGKLSYEDVLKLLGATDIYNYSKMFACISEKDCFGALKLFNDISEGGAVSAGFITDFVSYLRNLLIITSSGGADISELIDASDEDIETMKKDAGKSSSETLIMYIRILSDTLAQLRLSSQQKTITEMAIIKLIYPPVESENAQEALSQRLSSVEKNINTIQDSLKNIKNLKSVPTENNIKSVQDTQVKPEIEKKHIEALPEDIKKIAQMWDVMVSDFDKEMPFPGILKNAVPSVSDDGQYLKIMIKSQLCFDCMEGELERGSGVSGKEKLKEFIAERTGGLDVPLIIQKIQEKDLDYETDIRDIVRFDIEADDGKEDV